MATHIENTDPGEEPIFAEATPTFIWWAIRNGLMRTVGTCGLSEIWRHAHKYTVDDHEILIKKGIFHKTTRSIPVAWIQSVTTNKTIFGHCTLVVTTAGGREELGMLSRASMDRLLLALPGQPSRRRI